MKMRFINSAIVALLLTSCASKSSLRESNAHINNSKLYDPSTVTMIEGETYRFKEGTVRGRGQKFHSHHSYMRALVVGQ